jgi:hypothetical protein
MTVSIDIEFDSLAEAIRLFSRDDKEKLAAILEKELLSEFDDYEEREDVKQRVAEAMNEYEKGDYVTLNDLTKK